ncbi:A/G-specific adenine glycosylase [Methanoregula sp.]|uniref:A/G-specific adenine glycosylase n=1 Tax=Methanoregula sp. TaxID=2052170 RepID=UPI003BB1229F
MKKTMQTFLDSSSQVFSFDNLTDEAAKEFRRMVLTFYNRYGRHDMLWRHTDDPYRIFVSEIMLQQTQVERVAVKYPEFIDAFPDFASLARAPLTDVLKVWQGMGYNRRAISLKKSAEKMEKEFCGILPSDPHVLATFPGIGPATASSICAFAFNMPVVFIETNIRRVFIHFFFSGRESITDADILSVVERMLDRDNPRIWYWALMDFGAELKKSVPNPNYKSTAYVKQAPFAGSDRRIRGIILKYLLIKHTAREEEITGLVREKSDRVRLILAALEREGFLRKESEIYYLAE